MEITKRLETNELLSIFTKHYPNARVTNVEDFSTGCDNWIFCVKFENNDQDNVSENKVIMRFPRKLSDPKCPKMHQPQFQAFILNVLGDNCIPAPKLIDLSSNYLIESYLDGIDLSKVDKTDKYQLKNVFNQLGYYVKKLHSIKCRLFGYIVDIDSNRKQLIGKYDNWLQMFDNEFPDNLNNCLANKLIDQNMYQLLDLLFIEVKPYLLSYSEPKLLHSDICANNIRVLLDPNEDNCYHLSGFVDFADCMSGDPMFDLGELLLSYFGDYSVIEMFESGYGLLSPHNKLMIKFYAIHYNLWLLSSSVLSGETDKWLTTIQKLTLLKV